MFRLFKKTIAPPPDPLLPVLAFIGDFERGSFNRALGYHNKNDRVMPEVNSLRDALLDSGLIYGSQWIDFIPGNAQHLNNPAILNDMSAQEIQVFITGILRLDRLGEGFVLSSWCQHGMMLALLKRLKSLHENGEIAPLLQHT